MFIKSGVMGASQCIKERNNSKIFNFWRSIKVTLNYRQFWFGFFKQLVLYYGQLPVSRLQLTMSKKYNWRKKSEQDKKKVKTWAWGISLILSGSRFRFASLVQVLCYFEKKVQKWVASSWSRFFFFENLEVGKIANISRKKHSQWVSAGERPRGGVSLGEKRE